MESKIILPWPPSVNHYKNVGQIVTTKNGKLYQKRYNSPKTQEFFFKAWESIRLQAPLSYPDATISLEVCLDLYPPDKRRSDIDNRIKICLDSLQQNGVIANDFQIARLLVTRMHIIKDGQVIVRIKQL